MSELAPERTIGSVIRALAADRPNAPAIVGSHFALVSYSELLRQIDDVRANLRAAGFDQNARIAIAIANPAQATLAIVAISCSATAVPIDPKLTVPEVDRCLKILRPDAVVALRDTASTARDVAKQRRLPIIEARVTQPGRLDLTYDLPKIGSALPPDEPNPHTPIFILHTSGTTADPNLVPFSHRNMLAVTERLQTWFGLTPQDRCLTVSPVYYSHALTTAVLPPLLTGGSTAFPANAVNVDPSEWFGDLKPTWYSAGPTLHLAVLEKLQQRADARSMHSLRFVSSAGAPLAADMGQRMQDVLGVPVLEHYGSSETAQIATNRAPPGRSKPGTVGIPWPGIVSIVDDEGRELPPGERGEILIRGPSVTAGYLNAPELNLLSFIDGAYRTGDIGSLDADGFLSLHGRVKELINRGGEKISPLEVDQALLRHSEVAQAAAYAVPHPRLGEDVAAAVILRPGAGVTPEALREFLTDKLAPFKIPHRIVVVDQLPKGISGKVQRKRLSEMMNGSVEGLAPVESRLHSDLMQIWKKILKIDAISVDDNFFEKGGDSLLAMDVSVELERLTGKAQPEAILFEAPTIRQLVKRLTGEMGGHA
ncbi:MAG TPA: non-ribosomal peptide synthetase [Pseudorhodoplanes sp.]|nr:non-ribosomal peptide synthetase [Pseudorhodoplanes sp.]